MRTVHAHNDARKARAHIMEALFQEAEMEGQEVEDRQVDLFLEDFGGPLNDDGNDAFQDISEANPFLTDDIVMGDRQAVFVGKPNTDTDILSFGTTSPTLPFDHSNAKSIYASSAARSKASAKRLSDAVRDIWSRKRFAEDSEDSEDGEEDADNPTIPVSISKPPIYDADEVMPGEPVDQEEHVAILKELTAVETLNERFRREEVLRSLGMFNRPYSAYAPLTTHLESRLTEGELAMITAFFLKVDALIKDSQYEKIAMAFPKLSLPATLYVIRRLVERLSGVKAIPYDCCINSCILFYGLYANDTKCRFCKEDRYNVRGAPRKQFHYLPLIPRLLGMYLNRDLARLMKTHRHQWLVNGHEEDTMKDIYDSELYQDLLNRKIEVGGDKSERFYFEDEHDIALGISIDGFGPFKSRKATCWPLIAFNYNLPADIRFHKENIIPIAVIPGPKQARDMDSFFLPFAEECIKLETGITAFDADSLCYFILFVFLIIAFGDIPAVAKLMNMKGVNGCVPCRACSIHGITIPGATNNTHYVPLSSGRDHPIDHHQLPLRTHIQFMQQAREVSEATTATERGRLAKEYGIKSIPVLSLLSALRFPDSFPPDFMHVVLENVIKELLALWTGEYKGMNLGGEGFVLAPHVQKLIGQSCVLSGNTIPAAYGCRIPDPFDKGSRFIAESWSGWALQIAPVLLRGRFPEDKFYDHFMELVELLSICLALSIKRSDIVKLKDGFAKWVMDFERLVRIPFRQRSFNSQHSGYMSKANLSAFQCAPSLSIIFFILPTVFVFVGRSGAIGPIRWSAFVAPYFPR
jgi:hypothetical protein